MKKLIYIKDNRFQKHVSLNMILNEIGNEGTNYKWSILELEAEGDLEEIFSYEDIDHAIQNNYGYSLTWEELVILAKKFDQVINTIIVAYKNNETCISYETDIESIYKTYPITISILDGDFWEVCSNDMDLIKRLESKYEHTEIKNIK